jgi:hypothetical protein
MSLNNLRKKLIVLGYTDLANVICAADESDKKISKFLKSSGDEDILKNSNCSIEYTKSTKKIFGRDLTDMNNEPAFYNKGKRNIGKAWNSIVERFDEDTTMHDVIDILMDEYKIMCHSWCMMD